MERVRSNPLTLMDPAGLHSSGPTTAPTCCSICVLRAGGRKGDDGLPGYCIASIPCDVANQKSGWSKQSTEEYVRKATCGYLNTCCPTGTRNCRRQKNYAARQGRKHGPSWPDDGCLLLSIIAAHDRPGQPLQNALDAAECRGGCQKDSCHAGGHADPYCHLVKKANGKICQPKEVKGWDWMKDHMWVFSWCGSPYPGFFVHCDATLSKGLCEGACRQYCDSDKVPIGAKRECATRCDEVCRTWPDTRAATPPCEW